MKIKTFKLPSFIWNYNLYWKNILNDLTLKLEKDEQLIAHTQEEWLYWKLVKQVKVKSVKMKNWFFEKHKLIGLQKSKTNQKK